MTNITELQLQQGFQTLLQSLAIFANADVVIDDDTFLDDSTSSGPWAVIWTSQNARFTPAPGRMVGTITIPISLVEEFKETGGWGTTYAQIRSDRQTIFDGVFTGVGLSANGLDGVSVVDVTYLPFIPILPVGATGDDVNAGTAWPVYIESPINVTVELF